jgi:ABC-type uncharacterized transport system permease subunit
MGDTAEDPVDHARTTRKHAGEAMKNGTNGPGLIAVGLAVVVLVGALFALATGHAVLGSVCMGVAVIVGGAGLAWLAHTHRMVRIAEQRWLADHPQAHAEPPTS